MSNTFNLRSSDFEVTPEMVDASTYVLPASVKLISTILPSGGRTFVTDSYYLLGDPDNVILKKLNNDGTIDSSFSPTIQFYTKNSSGSRVRVLKTAQDKLLLIFTQNIATSNGLFTRQPLIRLNLDGSPDCVLYNSSGTTPTIYGTYNPANIYFTGNGSIAGGFIDGSVYPDGSHLVCGKFLNISGLYGPNITPKSLTKLDVDGIEDFSFVSNLGHGFHTDNNLPLDTAKSANVYTLKVQSDNKILVGGDFLYLNRIVRNRLVRLNSDGTEDVSFYSNLGFGFDVGDVRKVLELSDGKILVGGTFLTLNEVSHPRLVCLNNDGTINTAFTDNLGTRFNNSVLALHEDAEGKIYVGGNFTTFNGNTRNRLIRLNSDGTEDTTFVTTLGTGFNASVTQIESSSEIDYVNGDILISGDFTTFNGITRNKMVKLYRYKPRPTPIQRFFNTDAAHLECADFLTNSKKLYFITPKSINSAGVITTYSKDDAATSLENFQVSATSDWGSITAGIVTFKCETTPASGTAILSKLSDWEDAGYISEDYPTLFQQILRKVNESIQVTTENKANLNDKWDVLFLYNQGDVNTFLVLIYQGDDPMAEETIVL